MSEASRKVLRLLQVVGGGSSRGVASTEAAQAAGLDKTTASRLLKQLTDDGWLMRDSANRHYFAGPVLIELAHATGYAQRAPAVVNDVLRSLQADAGETVAFHQLAGRVRLCVAGFEARQEVRSVLQLGETRPLDRGASGRTMLAFCDSDVQEQVLAELTDGAARALLRRQLPVAAARGYLSTESNQPGGSAAIAAAVFDATGIFGAVAIAGPAVRFTETRRNGMLDHLLAAASQISKALGGSEGLSDYQR